MKNIYLGLGFLLILSCKNVLDVVPGTKLPVFKDFSLDPFNEMDNVEFDLFDDFTDPEDMFMSCTFDQVVDQTVVGGMDCSTVGASVNSEGKFQWTPDYSHAGVYEFKIAIEMNGRLSQKIFDLTIMNTNAPPVLESIADQSVNENSAITTINAADGGDDFDLDSHPLTYSCNYDQVIDSSVSGGTACTSLPGTVTFNASSGEFNWTPDFTAAGNYEVSIIADDGNSATDEEIFQIIVNNVNRAPVLDAIADESVNENSAITQINAADGGDDQDIDLDNLTYSCVFETTINGTFDGPGTACSSLPGTVSFNSSTGVLDWTPSYVAAGVYEVWINGSDGSLSDDELIVLTINNVNRAPVLDAIANQSFNENVAMTQINAADGGDDQDIDLQNLIYSCNYETTINGSIDAFVGACTTLPGTVSFNTSTGVFDWTPDYTAQGTYEVWINGSDGSLSDDELVVLTINNVNQPPVLDAIADDSVQEAVALSPSINAADGGDDNDVDGQALTYSCTYDIAIDGVVAAGSACSQANLGGTFSFNTGTGVFDWTPSTSGYENGGGTGGQYEFKIVASDGSLSDDEIFVLTVSNNLTPDVSSIVRQTPSGQYTNATSVVYRVTFSESVENIDTSDFSLNTTGTAAGTIASVSAASGTTVDVTVNTISGDGDIRLDIVGGSDIDDGALGLSNIPFSSGEIYTIDNTNPTVVGITRNDTNPTSASSVTFNVEFSEAVSTSVVGDFANDFSVASGAIASVVAVDTTNFTVTVNSITGTGTISIDFVDGDNSVTDPAGNDVADYTTGEAYNIDNTAPSVSSIARADALLVDDADANFTVTFSEDVSTPVNGDFQLAVTSGVSGSISTITGGPQVYNVLVNTITGSGTLELELNDSNNSIVDTSGNTLSSNTFNTGEIYNVNHQPSIDFIADASVNENSALAAINANDNTDDLDVDGDTLTYSCTYDIVIDAAVVGGTTCSQANLGGTFSFNTSTGAFAWTPDYDGNANGDGSGRYEFRIVADDGEGQSNSNDAETFVITVNDTNRAPLLDAIGDESVAENSAITQINADDGGDDNDIDGDALTYSCNYETTINGTIDSFVGACTALPGIASFNTSTGVFDWTPDYTAAGTYEIWINGSDGSLSDDELIVLTITNTNQAPVLDALPDRTVAENSAMTALNAQDGSNDLDADGDVLSYTCIYETTINGTQDATVGNCDSLPGTATFNTSTGIVTWTPDYTAAGVYELWFVASDGSLSSSAELSTVTVTNVDLPPELDTIGDQVTTENNAITQINAADSGADVDADGDTITYQCKYDIVIDAAVSSPTDCSSLTGASFNTATGVFDWTPDSNAYENGDGSGRYEMKIIATSSGGTDEEIFVITVNNTPFYIDNISSSTSDGAYGETSVINIIVTFNENITSVSGTPTITLNTGDVINMASYTNAEMYFNYTVGAGDNVADLDVTSMTAGTHIRNASADDANIGLPLSGASNDLAEQKNIIIDTTEPAFSASSFVINSGAATTQNVNLSVAFDATDNLSTVEEFCLKYLNSTQPTAGDSCWKRLDSADPGVSPANSVVVSETFTTVGFVPGLYTVYGFLKDGAGNISTHTATNDTDQDSITTFYNNPPNMDGVLVSDSAIPSDPPTNDELNIPSGNDVHIKWNVSDVEGLAASPIDLYYTTDGTTWLAVPGGSGLLNGANSCTVNDGGTTADDTMTGCFIWSSGSPTSSFFRIKVEATDSYGTNASAYSTPLNDSNFSVIAGNTDRNIGNIASSSVFSHTTSTSGDDSGQTFMVLPNGDVYIWDVIEGIIKIDAQTGLSSVFIPKSSNPMASQYEGAISSAEVHYVNIMTLDYDYNLWIYDYDRIRKVDFDAGTIETVIGGGADTDPDNVLGTAVDMPADGDGSGQHFLFFMLPDGRLFFTLTNFYGSIAEVFYYYNTSDQKVYKHTITGTGSAGWGSYNPSTHNCRVSGIYMSHDLNKTNTTITEMFFRADSSGGSCGGDPDYINLNPSTWNIATPHPTSDPQPYYHRFQHKGMDGKIYAIDHQSDSGLYKWNESTRDWDKILGGADNKKGTCSDGTAATSCNAAIIDAFITETGQIYVNDGGAIRTIAADGNVYTLYGQKLNYGDGGLATAARFNELRDIGVWHDSGTLKVTVIDRNENIFREFSIGGNINAIIGNYKAGSTLEAGDDSTESLESLNTSAQFTVHPTTGDVFFHNGWDDALVWDRGADLWRKVYGDGGTSGPSASDGTAGTSISWNGYYATKPLAIDPVGRSILYGENDYNSGTSKLRNNYIFRMDFDVNWDTANYYFIAGQAGDQASSGGHVCADGTAPASCGLRKIGSWDYDNGNGGVTGQYYEGDDSWLIHGREFDPRRIAKIKKNTNVSTLTTLDNDALSFHYYDAGAIEYIFYCGHDGNLYKRDVTNSTETTLSIDTPGITCDGLDLHYDVGRNSLIFIFSEGGMHGVGEYKNPIFQPNMVTSANVVAWYDAGDKSSLFRNSGCTLPVEFDGDDVACIKDKSGSGNDMVQSSAANVPVYNLSNTSVNFDGSNDYLDAVSETNIPLGFSARSTFMSASADSFDNPGFNYVFSYGDSSVSEGSQHFGFDDTDCQYNNIYSSGGSCVSTATQFIFSSYYDGTNAALYLDGSLVDSNTPSWNTVSNLVRLGNQNRAVSEYWDGDISEVILYDADLSTADREKVEGYLACKWGTQASLPGGHPYASTCP